MISQGTKRDGLHEGYLMGFYGGSVAQITDGMSQTAAFAERLTVPPSDQFMAPTSNPQIWNRLVRRIAVDPVDDDQFADECRNRPLTPLPGEWVHEGYDHQITPNGNSCFYGVFSRGNGDPFTYSAQTASSLHTGGVNVAIADGSVRFVQNGIDLHAWRGLGTRSRAEVIGDF